MAKATRRIITLPPDWDAAFEAAAAKAGKTLSEWLRDAGADKLPVNVTKKLSEPLKGGRPKNQDE